MTALAVLGGPPLLDARIDESQWPEVGDDDVEAVVATLRSGRLSWTNDTEVGHLEKEFRDFVGTAHALALNSGTAALHAALAAVGVRPGDEVLVPALSFLASAIAVVHQQAIPVFVDVDPVTFTLDPAQLERHVTERTRAIVVVHLHGLPAAMDEIAAFAAKHGLAVVEDAAQAHGATHRDRQVGSIGDVGAFSIMAGKNLPTAGEGGLLTTDDAELRNRADAVKMFGERIGPHGERDYNAHTLGYNYRFSPILASMARTQLAKLERNTAAVRAGAARLAHELRSLPGVLPPVVPDDRTHVYHHFRVRLDPRAAGIDLPLGVFRQAVQDALSAEQVPVTSYQTRPLPGQAVFQELAAHWQRCPPGCGGGSEVRYRSEDHPATLDVIRGSLLLGSRLCMASMREPSNVDRYASAFEKVLAHPDELVRHARQMDYVEPWDTPARLW